MTMAVALAAGMALAAEHTKDTPDELKKNLAAGTAVLLDVREEAEWKEGRLKDAKHLPLSKLKAGITAEELAKLAPSGQAIYLHCAAGGRCLKAAELLKPLGRDLRALKPGYGDLLSAGLPKAP